MAQKMGHGEVLGMGVLGWVGEYYKKNPICMGFSIWDQSSLFLKWISGRPDQIIRCQNFTIIGTASECAQKIPCLFRQCSPLPLQSKIRPQSFSMPQPLLE